MIFKLSRYAKEKKKKSHLNQISSPPTHTHTLIRLLDDYNIFDIGYLIQVP